MKPADDIKKFFKNAAIDTNAKMDEIVLNKVITAHEKMTNTNSATTKPSIRRIIMIIMKSPITKLSAAVVITAALICVICLPGKSAWAQVVEAFNRATDVHIVKVNVAANGMTVRDNEAWIKNQTLFRAEAQDWCIIDDGKKVLTLYKNHNIAHLRESFTPYWDYTPVILKIFLDNQSEDGISVTRLPQECTATMDVYEIDFRDHWQGKAWVEPTTNLPLKISGREKGYAGQQKDFQLTFDYEAIADDIFSISIPADYRELPRIMPSEGREGHNEALSGVVVDEQGKPVVNARVFASYAHYGRADEDGNFSLLVSPIDGTGSIGPADFPIFVWAYEDADPYHVAWTLIRHPEAAEFRTYSDRMVLSTIDTGQERERIEKHLKVEETHQGVKLVIEDENGLSQSIPGDPGELFDDPEEDLKVRDIVLVMGRANVISGRVTNSNGLPIANATVQLEQMEIQLGINTIVISDLDHEWKAAAFAITDSQGNYSLNNLPIPWHKIQVKALADGYGSCEQEFENNGQNIVQGCDFKLVEGQSDDTSDDDDVYLITGRPRLGPSPEELQESEHFEQVVAEGYPIKGGGNSISEVVPYHLNENLILYYPFYTAAYPQIAVDISGNNFPGQLHGVENANDEILGGVMLFDGDEDYISVPDVYLREFTFSAWVKTTTADLNNRRIFLLSDGVSFFALQGNVREGVGACAANDVELNEYNWRLGIDTWTHITVTHDGHSFEIYKNGRLTEAGNIEAGGVTGTLYIGGTDLHGGDFWHGMIDEVALFNRALNAEEVEDLYSMTGAVPADR